MPGELIGEVIGAVAGIVNNVIDGMNQYATNQQKMIASVAMSNNEVLRENIKAQKVPLQVQGLIIVTVMIGAFVFITKNKN